MTDKNPRNAMFKLSAAAFQMAAVIGGFTWLGTFLDSKYATESLFTIVGALLGVGIGLYVVIKEVKQLSDENPPQ